MGAFQQLRDALAAAEAAQLRFTPASRWSLNGVAVTLRRLLRNGRAEVQPDHGGVLSVPTACLACLACPAPPKAAFARTFAAGSAATSSSTPGHAAEPGEHEGEDLSLSVAVSGRV